MKFKGANHDEPPQCSRKGQVSGIQTIKPKIMKNIKINRESRENKTKRKRYCFEPDGHVHMTTFLCKLGLKIVFNLIGISLFK